MLQTKKAGNGSPEVTPAISAGIRSLQGGGRPMFGSERSFFEPRFGVGFSAVRVHNNAQAANAARSINAQAFTLGRDVVFGAGEYSPNSSSSRKLFAHELAHVVQQNNDNKDNRNLRGQYTTQTNLNLQRKISASDCKRTGFTQEQCRKIDNDFERARKYLISAIYKLKNNKSNNLKKKALKLFFNLETNAYDKKIEENLTFILELLKLYYQGSRFKLGTKKDCNKEKGTHAYVEKIENIRKHFKKSFGELSKPTGSKEPKVPFLINYLKKGTFSDMALIHLCGINYLHSDPVTRATILIHECAHLIGIGQPKTGSDEIYFKSGSFYMLKSSQLLKNADSYAYFATALATENLPFVSPVHFKFGIGSGAVISQGKRRKVGWYVKAYIDVITKRPVLRFIYPFGRVSLTYVGIPSLSSNGIVNLV